MFDIPSRPARFTTIKKHGALQKSRYWSNHLASNADSKLYKKR